MRVYIIRRLLLVIPTIFLVSLIVFLMIRLIPGDAVDAVVARMREVGFGGDFAAGRAHFEQLLGLDVPVFTQYGRWLGVIPGADGSLSGIFQGDFGSSFWKPNTVIELIAERWPATVELGLLGIIIAQLIALPIGIYSALRQDTWGDYIARSFAIFCIAVPGFWIATMVIVFPSIWWGYMPPIMHIPFTEDPLRNLRMFIVPSIVLGMAMAGATMRMTRSMMLEVLRQDYIRTAWAKGLRERVVILRHTLKNALIPVVTMVGLQMPIIIGGAVIIEEIFCLHGMGRLVVDAIRWRDYPVLSGTVLIFGFAIVFINLMVDLTYAFLDPRIRYK
ncbi:Glutathione transport system permease protein GsiC [subsurface metagenome]